MTCPLNHPDAEMYLTVVPNDNLPTCNAHKVAVILDCQSCDRNGSWLYTFDDANDLHGIGRDIRRDWRSMKLRKKRKKK